MESIDLSGSAARLLHELVTEARHDIKSGHVSYGSEQRNAEVIEDLDDLDMLADVILAEAHA